MNTPKMSEISKLLAKIGKPGEKRDDKKQAVKDLFTERGASRLNPQGFDILNDLESYMEY